MTQSINQSSRRYISQWNRQKNLTGYFGKGSRRRMLGGLRFTRGRGGRGQILWRRRGPSHTGNHFHIRRRRFGQGGAAELEQQTAVIHDPGTYKHKHTHNQTSNINIPPCIKGYQKHKVQLTTRCVNKYKNLHPHAQNTFRGPGTRGGGEKLKNCWWLYTHTHTQSERAEKKWFMAVCRVGTWKPLPVRLLFRPCVRNFYQLLCTFRTESQPCRRPRRGEKRDNSWPSTVIQLTVLHFLHSANNKHPYRGKKRDRQRVNSSRPSWGPCQVSRKGRRKGKKESQIKASRVRRLSVSLPRRRQTNNRP